MKKIICLTILIALTATFADAQIVGWRMDQTGNYTDATPTHTWSTTDNVIWKTPMPAWSNASPVILGNRLFVCAEPDILLCLDKQTGQIVWQARTTVMDGLSADEAEDVRKQLEATEPIVKEIKRLESEQRRLWRAMRGKRDDPELNKQKSEVDNRIVELNEKLAPVAKYRLPKTHGVNGYTSPTPVTDGKHVYVSFGTGMVAAFDLDGNRKWSKYFDAVKSPQGWGHSTSPVLSGGKLFIHIQKLFALDPATGEIAYQYDIASKWGTPITINIDDTDLLVHPSGYIIRSADGKILAKDFAILKYNAPIMHDGILYCIDPDAYAFKLPEKVTDPLKLEQLWHATIDKDRHYSSPVLYEGLIYDITRGQTITVLDAETGEVVYEKKINIESKGGTNRIYSSVTEAGGYIYFSGISGKTIIVKPGREFVQVAENQLEQFYCSPVFEGSYMYIRGYDHMYCIGVNQKQALSD